MSTGINKNFSKEIPRNEMASYRVYICLTLLINAKIYLCYSLYPFILTPIGDGTVLVSKHSC